MSVWSKAFEQAINTEAEGAKLFQDILQNPTKYERDDNEQDNSGFTQPKSLSDYVKRCRESSNEKSSDGNPDNCTFKRIRLEEGDKPAVEESVEKQRFTTIGIQLCRAWFKHHYLGVGQPCKAENCQRKHVVEGRVEALHKDYAFKGLKPDQRKKIIDAVKKERAEAGSSNNTEIYTEQSNNTDKSTGTVNNDE